MKLIVQIPCFNEESGLRRTLETIPRRIDGIETVEILVVDDGSTDGTGNVAQTAGADHLIRNIANRGLAQTFFIGLDAALHLGADIIVNMDGDNQYDGGDIPALIRPILSGEAEMTIGDRQTDGLAHFHPTKKHLQKIGSRVVRMLSGTEVVDAVSGLRAFNRAAAMQLNIVSSFSYTIETVIQAGKKRLAVCSVPVRTHPTQRQSRLSRSMSSFIVNQINTMLRTYIMYHPLKVFVILGGTIICAGAIPLIRYLFFHLSGNSGGHVQSLILGAILFIVGFQILVLGLIGDVISFNRRLIENALYRLKRMETKR